MVQLIHGSPFGREALDKAREFHPDIIFIENPQKEDVIYFKTVKMLKTLKTPLVTVLNPEYEKTLQDDLREDYVYALKTMDLNEVRCSVEMALHDPTTLNRQGPDVGEQYRSVIFYHNPEQKEAATASKRELEISGRYRDTIVTQILPAGKFWTAEDYHQRYLEKRGRKFCGL